MENNQEVLEKRYFFARNCALGGDIDTVRAILPSLKNFIPREELEKLLLIGTDKARELWYDEALTCLAGGNLRDGKDYLNHAERYGKEMNSPLDSFEIKKSFYFAWKSPAPILDKFIFTLRIVSLSLRSYGV